MKSHRTDSKGPRDAALYVLQRVVAGDAYADIILEGELPGLNAVDRALATELVYGTLRYLIKIDGIIDAFSSIKTSRLEHRVLNALRLGVYQLLFLTRIPPSAAINESVMLVKKAGGDARKAGFVNAVLRKIDLKRADIAPPDPAADPVARISYEYSHPGWLVKRWVARYGTDWTAGLCRANLAPARRFLRVNTLVNSRDVLKKALEEEGHRVADGAFCPDALEVTGRAGDGGAALDPRDRRFYLQDEASQLIPLILAPHPGETALDACGAPGGKTTHIAALMKNTGTVIAMDRHLSRLLSVTQTAARLGAGIIRPVAADAAAPPFNERASYFDAALIDAPCTGLGVIGRSPDIKLRRKEDDIGRISRIQEAILDSVSRSVKKGGRLVYSACTFEPEETDGVIRKFLSAHPEFTLEDASKYLPKQCAPLIDRDGFFRSYPHVHGIDGFFAARLRRS